MRGKMQKPHHGQRTQRGTSMIEVLVAFLVLSFGLVGLTALQTRTITSSSSATAQATMVQILGSYAETTRATGHTTSTTGSGGNCTTATATARSLDTATRIYLDTFMSSCDPLSTATSAGTNCNQTMATKAILNCPEPKSGTSFNLWYATFII